MKGNLAFLQLSKSEAKPSLYHLKAGVFLLRHDTHHSDIQQKDSQHNDTQCNNKNATDRITTLDA